MELFCGESLGILKKIPSNSIQSCITSPPYFHLRDYSCEGQIGLEDTLEEYINKLVEVFREVRRVLKNDGTLWVNIADTYVGGGRNSGNKSGNEYLQNTNTASWTSNAKVDGFKRKDLMLVPFELAKALRDDGWYLRQDIIWSKSNAMPESCRDRCTKSHEYIFLLSKSPKYFFDSQSIKEDCVSGDCSSPRGSKGIIGRKNKGMRKTFRGGGVYTNNQSFFNDKVSENDSHGNKDNSDLKRNKRSVWYVATAHSKVPHFATFPEKLIEPCVFSGTKRGDKILDPFMGIGTTGSVALKNGRDFVGIDINSNYVEIAENLLINNKIH